MNKLLTNEEQKLMRGDKTARPLSQTALKTNKDTLKSLNDCGCSKK